MNDKDEIKYCPYCGHNLSGFEVNTSSDDDIYKDAIRVVIDSGKASASLLQRRLRVGYARAARLIENMEDQGIIGPADGARSREVLISGMDELGQSDEEL